MPTTLSPLVITNAMPCAIPSVPNVATKAAIPTSRQRVRWPLRKPDHSERSRKCYGETIAGNKHRASTTPVNPVQHPSKDRGLRS
jgi:hypothetical protein